MKKQDNKKPEPISDAFEWFGCTADQIAKEEGTTPELDKATVKRVNKKADDRLKTYSPPFTKLLDIKIKHIK